jgi:NAD-dependent SIR2 family protein deacetylase
MHTLQQESRALASFIAEHPRLVVLSGAGISAASGIPTYRDQAGTWLQHTPIQEKDFLHDENTRRRYWSRSWYGWPLMRDAQPNVAHRALAQLESQGRIDLLITQNVDGLHQRAGGRKVVDLHGRVDQVRCLQCAARHTRDSVQALLASQNCFPPAPNVSALPDGNSDMSQPWLSSITLPLCHHCRGHLMPDVVFFGGSVPAATAERCLGALDNADALLAVGSSLMVFSGYRFCRHASRRNTPLAIINPGLTRADDLATLRLTSDAGPLLAETIAQLAF